MVAAKSKVTTRTTAAGVGLYKAVTQRLYVIEFGAQLVGHVLIERRYGHANTSILERFMPPGCFGRLCSALVCKLPCVISPGVEPVKRSHFEQGQRFINAPSSLTFNGPFFAIDGIDNLEFGHVRNSQW